MLFESGCPTVRGIQTVGIANLRATAETDRAVREQPKFENRLPGSTILSPANSATSCCFPEATAACLGCESCETLVGKTKPRRIFSHHLRRYFTSSRSCSAYWSVRSLCVCPIHIFSRSHGTQFLRSQDARKRRKMWKSHFSLPIFFKPDEDCRRTFRCDNGIPRDV